MQLRIALMSNAGGAAKSTMVTHLGYLLSDKYTVGLLDLDPQGSLSLFTGLSRPGEKSIAKVLGEKFTGDWNLNPAWTEQVSIGRVSVCQSDTSLVRTISELVLEERGAYALSDRLADFPLPQDILLFDCPATLGPLSLTALSASTHILIPCPLEPKSVKGIAELLTWVFATSRKLRLQPTPKILGIVPTQYDKRVAIHRRLKTALAPIAEKLEIPYFPPIRYSTEFKNASEVGIPIHLYRPNCEATKDFEPIVMSICEEYEKAHRTRNHSLG